MECKRKQRIMWLDFLRGTAMLLVVFDHMGYDWPGHLYFVALNIPLIFAVSGYLYSEKRGMRVPNLLYRVYVPLFVFSLAPLLIPKFIIVGQYGILGDFVWNLLFGWFLGTYVLASLLFRLECCYIKGKTKKIIISTFLALLGIGLKDVPAASCMHFNTLLICQWFMMLGHAFRSDYEHSDKKNKLSLPVISLIYAIAAVFAAIVPGVSVNYGECVLNNSGLVLLLSLISLFMGYEISQRLKYKSVILKIVCFFGRNSILLYILHGLVLSKLKLYSPIKFNEDNFINSFMLWLATVAVCGIVCLIVDRYFPILLGIRSKSKCQDIAQAV